MSGLRRRPRRLVPIGASACIAALVVSLAACSSEEPDEPSTPPTSAEMPQPEPEPEVTSEPEIELEAETETATQTATEPEPEPEATSEPLEGGPVLAVKIDHVDPAAPRYGIGSADVVYVDMVEYGLTRLLAVFITSMPDQVGPVRSARPNDPSILANYGPVAFVYSGSSGQTRSYLDAGDQIEKSPDQSSEGFWRDPSRQAPHDLMGEPDVLLQRGEGSNPPEDIGFRFGDPAPGGEDATLVSTNYPMASLQATYDPDSDGYEVATNGRVEIDASTGDPVRPATIVVQFVDMPDSTNVTGDGQATPESVLEGTGEAIVLRNGQAWEGTWSRDDLVAPTHFQVGDDELTFAPGPVWVWFVPTGQSVTVE